MNEDSTFYRFRKALFEILDESDGTNKLSSAYDYVMIVMIVLSLIPLAFKQETAWMYTIDAIAAIIFIADYLLRWFTADFQLKDHSAKAFIKYPFTVMAIIDLLSVLPSLTIVSNALKLLRVLRLMKAFRVFHAVRYSRSLKIIGSVLKSSKNSLLIVVSFAIGYVLFSALVVFNIEPDTFNNYIDAVYWATVSLTTVGYGDIYPVTTVGKIFTMLSSVFGIAIVALPASIITAGFMDKLNDEREQKWNEKKKQKNEEPTET